MKDRAAGRRLRRRSVKTAWVEILPNIGRFMDRLAEAVSELGRVAAQTAEAVGRAFYSAARLVGWLERERRRNEWVASHQLTAIPSPWAAPITKETSS
ncbi:hypothetical protein [Curtobacterium sp. VKM Ac-2884]|uniref:hypothetical protein n=1 Tax=Curtobacterium sp. VKM Ac-2884 TaxID=2783818 RepID=UPI00188CF06C|nr:hypothetical protein [Curtobacterium sp. VKM Ac-2884]MBF4603736.1 hypothetical protein [Curtobacterium sp. VKM Ac-2884]